MNVKPIRQPVSGEQIVGAQPALKPTDARPGWQRRLNLYTGRALGESALTLEQAGRAGRLAMSGRHWSHGVVTGLEVGLERDGAPGDPAAEYFFHVAAGFGLTVRGEDVWIPRNLRISLDDLFAYLPERGPREAPQEAPPPRPRGEAPQEAPPPRPRGKPAPGESPPIIATPEAAEAMEGKKRRIPSIKLPGFKRGEGEDGEAADEDTPPPTEVRAPGPAGGRPVLDMETAGAGKRGRQTPLPVSSAVRDAIDPAALKDVPPPAPDVELWERGSMIKPLLPSSLPLPIPQRGVEVGQAAATPLRRRNVPMADEAVAIGGRDGIRGKAGMPRAAILVLQPVEAELVGRPDAADPCEQDPANDAFADWQVVDGARLVLYAFPWEDRVDTTPQDTWRNRLAYEVFQAEAALPPGEHLPWEEMGLPIGLVGFDEKGAPLWVDGFAVVRDGGRPHRRTPLLHGVGDPFLWQARLQQFAEQVAEVDWATADPKAELARFAYLPPAGLLPRSAVDLEKNQVFAFPEDYVVEAVPVPLEQLDAAIEASAPLQPFDLGQPDRVRVMVPVPQAFYEPRLLLDDAVDPQFGQEIAELSKKREDLLLRREDVRRKTEAVVEAVTGTRPDLGRGRRDPDRLEEVEGVSVPVPRYGGRAHESPPPADPRQPLHQHVFENAQPLKINPGETLYAWVWLDPANPPRTIVLQWRTEAEGWEHRALWGEDEFQWGTSGTKSRWRMGDLPVTGDWVRLEVPAHRVGLENRAVIGMAFTLMGGHAWWDRAGRITSTDRVWFDDALPDRAIPAGTFTWETANPAPFSGTRARQVPAAAGTHQHFFYSASAAATMRVERGDTLFAYVWLDPKSTPTEVMLQWNDGTWEHRAYWGANQIGWGVDGTVSRRHMGPLPPAGQWVRLEVPAAQVGLEGRVVHGMAFTLFGGRAAWDRAGRASLKAPAPGAGLRGEYYGTRELTNLVMTRLDPQVAFQWGGGDAAPGVGPDEFSVRWTGYVVPKFTEEYTFYTNTDDGARLWVDGKPLIDDWKIRVVVPDAQETGKTIALQAGRRYRIVMEYFEAGGGAAAYLKWSSPNTPKEVIPTAALFPPGSQPEPDVEREEMSWVDDDVPPGATMAAAGGFNEAWTWVGMPSLDPPEPAFGTVLDHEALRVEGVDALKAELSSILQPDELDRMDRVGVERFVAELDARVRRADDHVDFSFLRVQSDIYRLRQLMLGTTAATRLATSPTLAGIINSESALNVREQLLGYMQTVKGSGKAATPATTTKTGQDQPSNRAGSESTNLLVANTYFMKGQSWGGWNIGAIGAAMGTTAKKPPAGVPAAPAIQFQPVTAAAQPIHAVAAAGMDTPFRAARYMSYTPIVKAPAARQAVRLRAPIVGEAYDFRTVTVAERLDSPAANEAKSFAVLSRYEVLQGLAQLDLPLDDVMIPGFIRRDDKGEPMKRTIRPARAGQAADSGAWVWVREARRFGEVRHRLESLVLEENDPSDADEAGFFSMAVELLDSTVAALRNVEGRVQQYRGAVERAQDALEALHELAQSVDARLKTIGDDLAETRHDLAVARALLKDEEQRVAAVNERRQTVLRDHVHFFAFQRPRLAAGVLDAPARPLNPAFTQSPVPACLADTEAAPPELRAIVEVLREAPLHFFRNAARLLDGLDSLAVLRGTLESARVRAQVRQAPSTLDALEQRLVGRLGTSIARTLLAQRQVVAMHRQRTSQMDLGHLTHGNWLRVRDEALRSLSLGDLIDASHGRTGVDRGATRELDDLLKVATCLYREIGQVKPAIRLDWAEALSQYDQAADLHNLFALPRFNEIDYLSRREMQALVDWLYGRFDTSQAGAGAMMSDVVRVCVLLASHAPVNQIIAASVPRETEARVGGTVEVAADPVQVRVGMHVLMYDVSKRPVHAVVEDLNEASVVARVVHAAAQSVTIAKDTRAQLGEEARLAAHATIASSRPRIAPAQAKR